MNDGRPIEPVRAARLKALLDGVQALPDAEAEVYLRAACGSDMALLDAVRREREAQAHTSALTTGEGHVAPAPIEGVDAAGHRFGAWRAISALGAGGMGSVHLAERVDGAYSARAALKLLNPWLLEPGYVQRFVQERQILARLTHPGIAKLLDGGVSDAGVPWLAMEFVEGEPIVAWARRRGLGVRDRLRVTLAVCDAVQHAHQNLVIHRDIKPGNILVTADGEPKLLDFGIAKVLGEGAVDSPQTATRLLTPEYASPEQLRGEPVSTASDVYSLGVVLYELLTLERPPRRTGKADDPVPTRPSSRIARTLRDVDTPPADRRWLKRLRGDLDTVVLKALAVEPVRRYATVREFADDLRNVLDAKPVSARPDSWGYRLRLFVRRNRFAVALSVGAFALLFAAAVGLALLSLRLRDERDGAAQARADAERQTQVAERVAGFALDLLSGANPRLASGALPTVRDLLDRGVVQVREQLADEPEVQARMMGVMAEAYRQLGVFDVGITLAQDAVAIRERRAQADPAALSDALDVLGEAQRENGRFAESEATHRRALALREALAPADDQRVAQSLNNLSLALQEAGRYAEALPMQQRSYEIRLREEGPDVHPTIAALVNLGILRRQVGEMAAAEADFRTAYERRLRVLGERHISTANVQSNLARQYYARGALAEAEDLERRALKTREDLVGPRSVMAGDSHTTLGTILAAQGRWPEAEAQFREGMSIDRDTVGADHPDAANNLLQLGVLLHATGRLDEAEVSLRDALRIRRAALTERHAATAWTELRLADLLIERGRLDEAGALIDAADAGQAATLPEQHPDRAMAQVVRARLELAQGRAGEAVERLDRACALLAAREPVRPNDRADCDSTRARTTAH